MGLFAWFKPKPGPLSPRLRLVVFAVEEPLPWPTQIAHPDGLVGALVGIPSVPERQRDSRRLVDQPMEAGSYLVQGLPAEVLVSVERRVPGSSYPGRDLRRSPGSPVGAGPAERERLEKAPWRITLELVKVAVDPGQAVLYAMEMADRLATLVEGVVLDEVCHRYYLAGKWRVAGLLKPLEAREHVVLHLEIGERGSLWVHTHGLAKFGRPELEVLNLPEALGEAACRLMIDLSQRVIGGTTLQPGEKVGDPNRPLVVRRGRAESVQHWEGPSLELVDAGPGTASSERGATQGIEAYLAWT